MPAPNTYHGRAVAQEHPGEAVSKAHTALAQVALRQGQVRVGAHLDDESRVADGGLLAPLREEDDLTASCVWEKRGWEGGIEG